MVRYVNYLYNIEAKAQDHFTKKIHLLNITITFSMNEGQTLITILIMDFL